MFEGKLVSWTKHVSCYKACIGKSIIWFLVSTRNSKLKEQKSLKLI